MIEVEIKNFQSIERVVLTIDGFTALLGRSNIGKSAAIRAVKAALTGSAGTAFVRHGPSCARRVKKAKTCKCFCSVHLKGQEFDLLWEKGDAVNRYTYNGQVYDRVERGVPEFLVDKFATVKVGDTQELIQCSDQFSPIFLLNQTGGVIAEVLSDAARLDRINVAMKLAEKDRREAVSTRKVREQDLTILASKLVQFDGLDVTLIGVQAAKEGLAELETAQQSLGRIERFIAETSHLKEVILGLRQVVGKTVPDSIPLQRLETQTTRLEGFVQEMTTRVASVRALQGVSEVQPLEPEGLVELQSQANQLQRWVGGLDIRQSDVDGLQGVVQIEVPVPEDLPTRLQTALRLQVWLDRLVAITQTVKGKESLGEMTLGDPVDLTSRLKSWQVLSQLQTRYQALTDAMGRLQEELVEADEDVREAQQEVNELGACPTCARPLVEGPCHV